MAHKPRTRKTVPFSVLNTILRQMTNWQNSQWLRSGGPALRVEDLQLASAKLYAGMSRLTRLSMVPAELQPKPKRLSHE